MARFLIKLQCCQESYRALFVILFQAYINDLPQYVQSNIHIFADDTVIYLRITSINHCIQLQQHLPNLEACESDWKMEFNIPNCNVLRITRKQNPYIYEYTFKGQTSDSVHSVKYLGAYLSDDLRWNENVKNVSNKANKTIGFLKRNLRHCPPRTKETAYCSCVWDPYRAKNTNKLEMVERKAECWVLNRFSLKR